MLLTRLFALLILPVSAFAADTVLDSARFNGHYQLVSVDGKEGFYDFKGPCHGAKTSQDGNVTNIDLTHYQCDNLTRTDVPLHSTYSSIDSRCPKDLYIKNNRSSSDQSEMMILLSDGPGNDAQLVAKLYDKDEDSSTCEKYEDSNFFQCLIINHVFETKNKSWTYESESDRISNSESDYQKDSTDISIEKEDSTLTLNSKGTSSMFDGGRGNIIVQGEYYVALEYDFSCKYRLAR